MFRKPRGISVSIYYLFCCIEEINIFIKSSLKITVRIVMSRSDM